MASRLINKQSGMGDKISDRYGGRESSDERVDAGGEKALRPSSKWDISDSCQRRAKCRMTLCEFDRACAEAGALLLYDDTRFAQNGLESDYIGSHQYAGCQSSISLPCFAEIVRAAAVL
ncbi:hypothetical protein AMECASPLE_002879 [Ameca splendens]|uniref:Uncharacterized protein n=1 Tax=Ameca splendens TaxID=208324 RepID=A0ABV0XME6_9TELE